MVGDPERHCGKQAREERERKWGGDDASQRTVGCRDVFTGFQFLADLLRG